MGLNDTPSGERIHIGFFGRRNAGKSSIVNAVTGQELSVVSDVKGTTTDPVMKSMELLPMGPIVIIDTPGFDDVGELGALRVKKTKQILNRVDCAVLVVDAGTGKTEGDEEMIALFLEKEIPYLVAWNKWDIRSEEAKSSKKELDWEVLDKEISEDGGIAVSARNGYHIHELKERISRLIKNDTDRKRLVGDLIKPCDTVVLVVPIDESAPKGRLILPQQQAIRDILEAGAISVVARDEELSAALQKLGRLPDLVITDSQAFASVAKQVPAAVKLTSFSILMARYKGFLETAVEGVKAVERLKDGDRILLSEGCTHHRQCNDIGTVKIPNWLRAYSGKELVIETASGRDFPEDLSAYRLIIHCGGCMLGSREMRYRQKCAQDAGVPFCNYGIVIAKMKGILERSLEIFIPAASTESIQSLHSPYAPHSS